MRYGIGAFKPLSAVLTGALARRLLRQKETYSFNVLREVVLDDSEGDDDLPHGYDELRRPEEDEQQVPAALLNLVRVLESFNGEASHGRGGDLCPRRQIYRGKKRK